MSEPTNAANQRRLALWLLHARSERLYPHLPRFMQRWVYRRTVSA